MIDLYSLITKYQAKERDFFDFKVEWHDSQAELIKDILHLSNSFSFQQKKYLIFGIDNNGNIKGVENNSIKHNTASITNTLHANFLNRSLELSIFTQKLKDDKNIEILSIETKDEDKPYFLGKDYNDKKNKVHAGIIYTRTNDSNCIANDNQAEQLWKFRFHLHLLPSERMKKYINDIHYWERINIDSDENKEIYYYSKFPDFRIEVLETPYKSYEGKETQNFPDKDTPNYRNQVILFFNSRPILENYFINYDGFRYFMPQPSCRCKDQDELEYFYTLEDELWLQVADIIRINSGRCPQINLFWMYSKIKRKYACTEKDGIDK